MTKATKSRDSSYIRYRGVRAMNRDVFLLSYKEYPAAYDTLHDAIGLLAQGLREKRDVHGKSHVSFIPFLALMQRQTLSAFDHLASFQAYQAWVMTRPAIEIPLIMGKWIDDPENAQVWKNRESNAKAYIQAYSGKKMQSAALPLSEQFQSTLSHLNDDFVHPNPFYYSRHLLVTPAENHTVSIELDYFDDQEIIEAHVLAFLHLIALLHDSLLEMLEQLLDSFVLSRKIAPTIESHFLARVQATQQSNTVAGRILSKLGIWQPARTTP